MIEIQRQRIRKMNGNDVMSLVKLSKNQICFHFLNAVSMEIAIGFYVLFVFASSMTNEILYDRILSSEQDSKWQNSNCEKLGMETTTQTNDSVRGVCTGTRLTVVEKYARNWATNANSKTKSNDNRTAPMKTMARFCRINDWTNCQCDTQNDTQTKLKQSELNNQKHLAKQRC